MATTGRGIVYPVVGDNLTPLANHFANLATTTDTAIANVDNSQGYFIGTDAQRTALAAPKLREGITWRTTDTDITWRYDGSSWAMAESGTYLIRPASVVNATVTSAGLIIPNNGSTTFSVNGVFSTAYSSYDIHGYFNHPSNAQPFFRFRGSGSDATATSYAYQSTGSTGTTSSFGANSSVSFWSPSVYGAQFHSFTLNILAPVRINGNSPKFFGGQSWTAPGNSVTNSGGYFGDQSFDFDGFTFYNATFNNSSWLKIYGRV